MFDLYLITDPQTPLGMNRALAMALEGAPPGRIAVQLRDRHATGRALLEAAVELRRITEAAGALLIVNQRVDIAVAAGADGVQLPEDGVLPAQARGLLPARAIIGASRHDRDGVTRAFDDGADFVCLAPFGEVPHKGPALGPEGFSRAIRGATGPVFALGGIGVGDVSSALAAGAAGVSVLRAVSRATAPDKSVAELISALDSARGQER